MLKRVLPVVGPMLSLHVGGMLKATVEFEERIESLLSTDFNTFIYRAIFTFRYV